MEGKIVSLTVISLPFFKFARKYQRMSQNSITHTVFLSFHKNGNIN